MKKLTKVHAILIAMLIAVLAVTAYFSFSYRGAEAKQPDIKNEINQALMQLKLAQEENDPTPLQEQLDELQDTLDSLVPDKPLFPEKPATVEIGDLIVDSVEKLNLTLLKLSPEDEAGTVTIKSDKDSEGNKYNKAQYEVKVKGDLGRIVSFIGEIENAEFATITLEDIELIFEEEEEEEKTITWWESEFKAVTLYECDEE